MLRRIHILTVLFFFLVSGITSLAPVRAEGLRAEGAGVGAVLAPIDLSQEDGVAQGEGWHWDGTSRVLSLHNCDLWFSGSGFSLPENSSVQVKGDCTIVTGAGLSTSSGAQSVAFDANASYSASSSLDIGPSSDAATSASLTIATSWQPGKASINSYGSICHMMGDTSIHDLTLILSGREAGIFSDASLKLNNVDFIADAVSLDGYSFEEPRWWLLSTSGWLSAVNSHFRISMLNGIAAMYATDLAPSEYSGQILLQDCTANIDIKDYVEEEKPLSNMLAFHGSNGLLSDGSTVITGSNISIFVESEDDGVPQVRGIPSANHVVFNASTVDVSAAGGKGAIEVASGSSLTLMDDAIRKGVLRTVGAKQLLSADENDTELGGESLVTPLSRDTGIASISVRGISAEPSGPNAFKVVLPPESTYPQVNDIQVVPVDGASRVSDVESHDDGRIWEFIVTAENGDTARYTLTVDIASDNESGGESGSGGVVAPGDGEGKPGGDGDYSPDDGEIAPDAPDAPDAPIQDARPEYDSNVKHDEEAGEDDSDEVAIVQEWNPFPATGDWLWSAAGIIGVLALVSASLGCLFGRGRK